MLQVGQEKPKISIPRFTLEIQGASISKRDRDRLNKFLAANSVDLSGDTSSLPPERQAQLTADLAKQVGVAKVEPDYFLYARTVGGTREVMIIDGRGNVLGELDFVPNSGEVVSYCPAGNRWLRQSNLAKASEDLLVRETGAAIDAIGRRSFGPITLDDLRRRTEDDPAQEHVEEIGRIICYMTASLKSRGYRDIKATDLCLRIDSSNYLLWPESAARKQVVSGYRLEFFKEGCSLGSIHAVPDGKGGYRSLVEYYETLAPETD